MKRTLYIGDVHGCAKELAQIVEDFGYVRGQDTIYQTGDIINKGPYIWESIQLVESLNILPVRGNHEEHLIRMFQTDASLWTEKQKMRFSRLPFEKWVYIKDLVYEWPFYRDTPFALLVHAGLEPGKQTLESMNKKVLLSVRMWNDLPWFKQTTWKKPVIFGHWAKMGLVQIPGFIGLDSGCVYGRELSAYCPEEDKFYFVKAKQIYSPVKTKTETALEAPCIIPQDFKEEKQIAKEDLVLKSAAPKILTEWSGYSF